MKRSKKWKKGSTRKRRDRRARGKGRRDPLSRGHRVERKNAQEAEKHGTGFLRKLVGRAG